MGLGKTLQAITLMLSLRSEGPHLVVCPLSVLAQWEQQIEQFAPTLRAGQNRELKGLKAGDVVLCSYGVLLRDIKKLQKIRWGVAVLDEAQAIKNPQSKTARSAYQLQARVRVATTGTPIENRLSELWSLFAFQSRTHIRFLSFVARLQSDTPESSKQVWVSSGRLPVVINRDWPRLHRSSTASSGEKMAPQHAEMAMAIWGKTKHYKWYGIARRHWQKTLLDCAISEPDEFIDEILAKVPEVCQVVEAKLPKDFPDSVSAPILSGLEQAAKKLN